MTLLVVSLALFSILGVTLWWRRRRVQARASADYMTAWRTFHDREFPHIHPAHLPPLKPLRAVKRGR